MNCKKKAAARSLPPNPRALSVLTDRLRRQSRRITGPRRAILEILRQQPHPLTNRELLALLPKDHCNLATVYRAMHLLERLSIVQQVEFGDGVARFELVGEGERGHHHHLICKRCAEVIQIDECFSGEVEKRIADQSGFAAVTHKLEFFGICPDCQKLK